MSAQGIGFVGIRTRRLEETVAVFRDLMELEPVGEDGGVVRFRLSDGTVLEIYGEDEDFHSFFTTGPVVGFRVTDFEETKARMVHAGLRWISEAQRSDGLTWQHFELPDGTVAEIIGPGRHEAALRRNGPE